MNIIEINKEIKNRETVLKEAASIVGIPLVEVTYKNDRFLTDCGAFVVLTTEEVTELSREFIENNLCCISKMVYQAACGFNSEMTESIGRMEVSMDCSCNPILKKLIEDSCGMENFINVALGDNEGRILSYYGDAIEVGKYNQYTVFEVIS